MRHLHIRPLQPRNNRRPQVHALDHAYEPLRNGVAPDDATENVDEDGGDFGVRSDEVKGLLDGLRRGATADVEEVGGLAAV